MQEAGVACGLLIVDTDGAGRLTSGDSRGKDGQPKNNLNLLLDGESNPGLPRFASNADKRKS